MQLNDKKVIVTGGPTREWIDPVRYISNASSGKMGIAIADAAYKKCKELIFIHGPIDASLIAAKTYRCIGVESTVDMLEAVQNELSPGCILIMAAAPADYKPVTKSPVKIKKTNENLTIELQRNPDILKTIAKLKKDKSEFKDVVLIGFAAETTDVIAYGKAKLIEKELSMICINDVSRNDTGFGSDYNEVTVMLANGSVFDLHKMTKKEVAEGIINIIINEL
ncbi:MAG: phosphopantothenoylcysteine decarboxylase [Spirochaetes bacterium]|nr:phosphopantothenoylcysteine decarboxylase [Spirochaetota bacterium]